MISPTKRTILIVEDNPLSLEVLRRRLEKKGFLILEVLHGDDVQGLLEQARPDLILLDMRLPGIDGWTLAPLIKAHPKHREIPIIAVTADAMPQDRARALAVGCDDYISKPIDFKLLLDLIEKFLGEKQGVTRPLPDAE